MHTQTLHPKGNIVRSEITAVEPCSAFPDRMHVFTISSKSSDKWHVSANDEVMYTSIYIAISVWPAASNTDN